MADPISQQGLYQDGNSIFENVHILGTLEVTGIVNTENNFTTTGSVKAFKFLGDGSELTGIDATTIKDSAGTTQIQGTTTGATHSGIAVFNELEVENRLYDGDGNFGTSGQVLSSDGTDTAWVNTGSLTAGAASEVGVTAVNTDSDHFITFVSSSSGNDNVNVDSNLKYNPSSNTIATIKINDLQVVGELKDGDGDFGTSGQVLSSDGTDTAWINAGSLTAGAAAEVGVTAVNDNSSHYVTFVDSSSGNENIKVDTNLTYNPSTNTLSVPNISGNGSGLSGIESFVTGMIILWYGATNNIPSGFVLCDGNNSTPDLRDRFVVGAGSAYSPNNTGGSSSITLAESQLPSHTHTASVSDPGHQHNTSVTNSALFPATGQITIGYGGPGGYPATIFTMSNATTGISVSNSSTGSGGAIENRPPYYALCYIMKT